MNNNLTILNNLPVNKTVVFYSPIEGKDVLVRTGTATEGSCFFHALLHAYSKEYVSMNVSDRIKYVKKLLMPIMRKKTISNGLISKIQFQENVNTILSDFYFFISKGKSGKNKNVREVIKKVIIDEKIDIEAYKLVTEMIPLNKFEKNILPSVYEKCDKSSLNDCKKKIISCGINHYIKEFDKYKDQLDDDNIKFYIKKLKKLLYEIVEQAETYACSEYMYNSKSSIEVDSSIIELISEKFNRDIYFIDSRTRMPYIINNSKESIKKRKSIIVIFTEGSHYEIVGRLLPGNNIQREFDFNDSLIKRIYTYLYEPNKIPDEYPNLITFLPNNLRNKLGFQLSDSEEEEHRSDSQYKSDCSYKSDGSYNSDSQYKSDGSYKSSNSPKSNGSYKSDSSYKSSDSPKSNGSYKSEDEIEQSSDYEKSDSDIELPNNFGINTISDKITVNK